MKAGLSIYNDANTLQIDDSYRNLMLVSKKNYSNGSYVSQAGDVFAFSGTGALIDRGDRFFVSCTGTAVIYGFSLIDSKPSDLGLEVYDPNGKLCYSAKSKPLRVLEMVNGAYFSNSPPTFTKSYGVTKCAVVIGQPYLAWRSEASYKVGTYDIDTTTSQLKLTPFATVITTDEYTYNNTNLSKFTGEYNYLVIDVSHY